MVCGRREECEGHVERRGVSCVECGDCEECGGCVEVVCSGSNVVRIVPLVNVYRLLPVVHLVHQLVEDVVGSCRFHGEPGTNQAAVSRLAGGKCMLTTETGCVITASVWGR